MNKQRIADEMTRLLANDDTSDLDTIKAQAIQNLGKEDEMTNLEWLEYYRFHPSEFESFIAFCEKRIIEGERAEARVKELETALNNSTMNATSLLYIVDREYTENMIGRRACDNMIAANERARRLLVHSGDVAPVKTK